MTVSCSLVIHPPIMSATPTDKLVESFENPTIPTIDGELTYATIHSLNNILN